MKISYKKINLIIAFLAVVSFMGCLFQRESLKNNVLQDIETDSGEVALWEGYKKPEGWKTIANNNYEFEIDYPEDWHASLGSGSQKAPDGISVGTGVGHAASVAFSIDPEKGMVLIEDNRSLVDIGGNAFKYFRGAYSQDVEDDDLIIYYPIGTSIVDITSENRIRVFVKKKSNTKDDDIETIKTIIKSFRKL